VVTKLAPTGVRVVVMVRGASVRSAVGRMVSGRDVFP
jgi:hypothetical protein